MDSISENVVAMIAVVVGILIIGTALVPIVQHASQGDGETVTGTNQIEINGGSYFLMITDTSRYVITINANDSALINGVEVDQLYVGEYVTDTAILGMDRPGTYTISGYAITGDLITTLSANTFPTITVVSADDTSVALGIPNAVVGVYSEQITAGPGQTVSWSDGTIKDGVILDSSGDPVNSSDADWITIVEQTNGTWIISDNGELFGGPQIWISHTSGGTSQYAALYGIIPIMCILAMAYVLIRRF